MGAREVLTPRRRCASRRIATSAQSRPDDPGARLHCFSEERAAKERAIVGASHALLASPDQALRRTLPAPYRKTRRQHSDDSRRKAAASPSTTTSNSTPGGFTCHRRLDDDPSGRVLPAHQSDRLGPRTYVTLTDIEAVFRSLKSELGLRPIFHHKPIRDRRPCVHHRHPATGSTR